ncbi:MAG: DNA-3-methyladenine glycosylase, partial [Synergistaceae bacterium]|nr:DNA-3-methyladenine glycosylase [Synergistaceae bacterium]
MNSENFFIYGEKELNYLKSRDKKLGLAIDKLGMLRRKTRPDHFEALAMSVVSQQISGKAADSIWNRLKDKFSEVSAPVFSGADVNDIQKCGMSLRKAGYIKGIAEAVMSKAINFGEFASKSDGEIIEKLSSLPGIGVWTAEMFLLFSMRRMDVVSWGDLAIRRGMMNIYGLKELTKEQFEKYRKRYSPYGSVASLYIWA